MTSQRCRECFKTYDFETGDGISWVTPNGDTAPPPPDRADIAYMGWLDTGARARCASCNNVDLPLDALVMGIFGQRGVGKDAMIRAIHSSSLQTDVMERVGIRLTAATEESAKWAEGLPFIATPEATISAVDPMRWTELSIGTASVATSHLLIYNTSGEQWIAGDDHEYWQTHHFLAFADALVICIPPSCLDGLDLSVRQRPDAGDTQTINDTLRGINRLYQIMSSVSTGLTGERIVVVVLTKCDRYLGVPGFPERVLRARHIHNDLRSEIIVEQNLLFEFIRRYGGERILTKAKDLSPRGKVYLAAISGTGADLEGMAPAAIADKSRALDPVLMLLMRRGVANDSAG